MDTLVRKQEIGSTASHGHSGPEAGDRLNPKSQKDVRPHGDRRPDSSRLITAQSDFPHAHPATRGLGTARTFSQFSKRIPTHETR